MQKPSDETGEKRFPKSPTPYAGDHAAMEFEVSRNGADSIVPRKDADVQSGTKLDGKLRAPNR